MDIIFDIDGTLADIRHRAHYLARKPTDWAAFQTLAHLDSVFEPIAIIAREMAAERHCIIICTGRGEQERAVTETWLDQHYFHYNALYMRTEGDYRNDDVVKAELLVRMRADGFDPVLAFEDRSRVVAMWRSHGIICAQVAEGDF